MNSKKIALIATLAALSLAVTVLAAFLPAKIVPLAVAALCYLLAFSFTGWAGGIACGVVVTLLTFVTTGLSSSFFLTVLLFFPYAVLAHALRKVGYTKKTFWIRILVMGAFLYGVTYAAFGVGSALVGSSLAMLEGKVGVWVACAVFTLVCLPADYFLVSLSDLIQKRMRLQGKGRKEKGRDKAERTDIYERDDTPRQEKDSDLANRDFGEE